MARLCFDYGHGGKDYGASYKGRKESDDVLSIGMAVAAEIRRHGVIVDETRTSDRTLSLDARSGLENKHKYDYFISFHRNAYKPEVGTGVESYTYLKGGSRANNLARQIQKNLAAVGFIDRGIKGANFHVLRETKAPAILIELGFIDNSKDNDLFDNKRSEIIKGLAKAILDAVGVTYTEPVIEVPEPTDKTLYRVMSGSYANRENAERQVEKLKKAGFDATIMIYDGT